MWSKNVKVLSKLWLMNTYDADMTTGLEFESQLKAFYQIQMTSYFQFSDTVWLVLDNKNTRLDVVRE